MATCVAVANSRQFASYCEAFPFIQARLRVASASQLRPLGQPSSSTSSSASVARALKRHLPTYQAGEGLGLDITAGAVLADHSHQELAEAVVQSLDVSEHPYARVVRGGDYA